MCCSSLRDRPGPPGLVMVLAPLLLLLAGGCDSECKCATVVRDAGAEADARVDVGIDMSLPDRTVDVSLDMAIERDVGAADSADTDTAGAEAGTDGTDGAGDTMEEPPPIPLPFLVLAPTLIDFGSRAMGASGGSRLTLTNTSNRASGTVTVSLWGVQNDNFVLVENTCAGMALAAGASCDLQVRFQAATIGMQQAVVSATALPGGGAAALMSATVTAD